MTFMMSSMAMSQGGQQRGQQDRQRGLSLLEMAIVLVVLGSILASLMPIWQQRIEQQRYQRSSEQLREARLALLGHFMIHGALPCPAQTATAAPAPCDDYVGFLPAVDLGLAGPTDSEGRWLDGWDQAVVYALAPGLERSQASSALLDKGLEVLTQGAASCSHGQLRATHLAWVLVARNRRSEGAASTPENNHHRALDKDNALDARFIEWPYSVNPGCRFDDQLDYVSLGRLMLEGYWSGVIGSASSVSVE